MAPITKQTARKSTRGRAPHYTLATAWARLQSRGRQAPASGRVKLPESSSNVSVVPESSTASSRASPRSSPPASTETSPLGSVQSSAVASTESSPLGSPRSSPPPSSVSGTSPSVSALSELSGPSAVAQWNEHVGEVIDEATFGDDRMKRTRRMYKILDGYVKAKLVRRTKRLHDGFTKSVDAKAKEIATNEVVEIKEQFLEAVKKTSHVVRHTLVCNILLSNTCLRITCVSNRLLVVPK